MRNLTTSKPPPTRRAAKVGMPQVEALERRVLCSAGDWRSASGLVRTTTHLRFGIGGAQVSAAAVGNRALFTGAAGANVGSHFTKALAIYDASTGKWSRALLSESHNSGTAVAVGGVALFASGYAKVGGTVTRTNTVDIYNVPTARLSTVQLTNNGEYVLTGAAVDDLAVFSTGDVYNSTTSHISFTQTLSQPPNVFRLPAAATSVHHLAFFAGGVFSVAATTRVTDTVNVYDTTTGQWSIAHLSQKRAGLAATSVGDLAMFAGGIDDDGNYYDTVDIYDAATGQWSVSHLSQANVVSCATTVGNFAMFGGSGATVDVYDAGTGVWFTTSLSSPRGGVAAAATANGKAFFAGGAGRDRTALDIFTLSPDITASLSGKPGGKVATTVQSTGDAALPAGTTISLYASPDRTLTGATLIGSATLPSGLAAQASTKLSIPTSLASVPAGKYHLIAAADDDTGQGPVVIASQAKAFTVRRKATHAKPSAPRGEFSKKIPDIPDAFFLRRRFVHSKSWP
jgi:hypothetical protein